MAELNDKLITYGNLSTFYDKLQEQGTIKNVSALPDASENKDKLFRLDNGEKDVYVTKLLSSETITTNRLPDEQQIDKAYLYESAEIIYYYKGTYEITCSDGVLNWYLWVDNDGIMVATEENFPSDFVNVPIIGIDAETGDWTIITETGATTTMSVSEVENDDTMGGWGIMALIPAIYNAPESAQIGNAYMINTVSGNDQKFVYNGESIIYDGQSWYKWKYKQETIYSNKPASEMYGDFDNMYYNFTILDGELEFEQNQWITEFYIPQLNAPDSEQVDNAYYYNINSSATTFYYTGEDWTIKITSDGAPTSTVLEEQSGFKLWNKIGNIEGEFAYLTVESANEVYSNNSKTLWLDECDYRDFETHTCYFSSEDFDIAEVLHDLFVTRNNYSYSTVKYQRTETIEEWGWEKVATEQYVDAKIGEKENKIDFTIGLSQATPGAMPTLDLSNLNNVTTDGVYNIAIVSDIYGTGNEYFGTGKLSVQNLGEGNGLQQTLSLVSNYALPKQELIVRVYDGSDWTEQSYPCALIVPQGYEQVVPYATYSATKINELISALETRIAALENPNT